MLFSKVQLVKKVACLLCLVLKLSILKLTYLRPDFHLLEINNSC